MKSLTESILSSINESQVKDTKEGKDFMVPRRLFS